MPRIARVLGLFALAAFLGVEPGCAGMGLRRPAGPIVTRSAAGAKAYAPDFTTAVYEPTTVAAADIYLTDLPIERLLDPRDNLSGLSGTILQMRLFLVPRAGNTPISNEACNITIRQFVLSSADTDSPEVGVYGGGGFLLPTDEPGGAKVGGTMSGVTLRLLERTARFHDQLGPSEVAGSFSAREDARTSRAIAARLRSLLERADLPADDQSTSIESPNE